MQQQLIPNYCLFPLQKPKLLHKEDEEDKRAAALVPKERLVKQMGEQNLCTADRTTAVAECSSFFVPRRL